jgi:hypothetical protein
MCGEGDKEKRDGVGHMKRLYNRLRIAVRENKTMGREM